MSDFDPDRIGCITASRIADMMAGGKGITRARYAAQLAAERMTGRPHRANFRSFSTDHGNEFEPIAAVKYELRNGVMLEGDGKVFVPHPFIELAGASPDRFVGDDGLVEIKNPDSHTYIEYLLKGEIPRDYRLQMTWQLACTRRRWCDWVAHDPDLPEEYGYIQTRFEPSPDAISDIEREVRFFNAEIEQLIQSIKERKTA